MKDYISTGLIALRDFYNIVNTKEKAILLIVLWVLLGTTYLGHRFAKVEVIERLMITYTKCVLEIELSRGVNNNKSSKRALKTTEIYRG